VTDTQPLRSPLCAISRWDCCNRVREGLELGSWKLIGREIRG
jgi:hypothetical protein